jgi:hypothetical protein
LDVKDRKRRVKLLHRSTHGRDGRRGISGGANKVHRARSAIGTGWNVRIHHLWRTGRLILRIANDADNFAEFFSAS